MIQKTAITGAESRLDADSPYSALVEFYHAFNTRDLNLMSLNWSQSDEVSMSNPLGGIKRGWKEIEAVYLKIFAGPASVYVEFYDFSIHRSGDMFCAVGRERGHLKTNQIEIQLAIRTSRIYRIESGYWKQIHHHGSIDKPALLTDYQNQVLASQ